jgi:hypothetical protein
VGTRYITAGVLCLSATEVRSPNVFGNTRLKRHGKLTFTHHVPLVCLASKVARKVSIKICRTQNIATNSKKRPGLGLVPRNETQLACDRRVARLAPPQGTRLAVRVYGYGRVHGAPSLISTPWRPEYSVESASMRQVKNGRLASGPGTPGGSHNTPSGSLVGNHSPWVLVRSRRRNAICRSEHCDKCPCLKHLSSCDGADIVPKVM